MPGPGQGTFWGADSCTHSIDSSDVTLLALSDLLIPRASYTALRSDDPNKQTRSESACSDLSPTGLRSLTLRPTSLFLQGGDGSPAWRAGYQHRAESGLGQGLAGCLPASAAAPSLPGPCAAAVYLPGPLHNPPLGLPTPSHPSHLTLEPDTVQNLDVQTVGRGCHPREERRGVPRPQRQGTGGSAWLGQACGAPGTHSGKASTGSSGQGKPEFPPRVVTDPWLGRKLVDWEGTKRRHTSVFHLIYPESLNGQKVSGSFQPFPCPSISSHPV